MKKDHIDALQADWQALEAGLDPEGLGIVLRVQALAREFMAQAEAALARFDLSWWQYDVLSALRRQGEPYTLSASELAMAGDLSSGAMTTRIDGLLASGLVERRHDDQDRRRVLVTLTAEGLARIDEAARARFSAAQLAQAGLSRTERRQLDGLLRRLLAEQ